MVSKTLKISDEIDPHIALKDGQRDEVAKALGIFLASTYTLYLKTQYYHWNVTGPHFRSLHKMFESQYKNLSKSADSLAERIRSLGHYSPGTYREFSKISVIKEDEQLPDNSDTMLQNLLADNEACSQAAHEALRKAREAEDDVTEDMLMARKAYHDETSWMIRSTLE
jgi:starvation-inducible DNA-binding protein